MRLLVVRDETSAVVDRFALTHGGREVVAVASPDEVPGGEGSFDAALIDIGSARQGLDAARQLRSRGLDCPTVVLGAEEPTGADLPDGVWLLLRPFSVADLDKRLREVTQAARERETTTGRNDAADSRLLGRLFGRRTDTSAPASSDRADEAEPHVRTDSAAPGSEEPSDPQDDIRHPVGQTSEDVISTPAEIQDELRVHRRLRGTPDPSAVPSRIAGALQSARDLVNFLRRNPQLTDRRTFAERVLEEAEVRLVTDRTSLWVPRSPGGYELLASSGRHRLGIPAEVDEDQPLFDEVRTRSDAVLITNAVAGAPPLDDIPGDAGPTVVAVALREGADLVGVLMADGDDLRLDDRDQLTALAERAGPQLRLAGLIETLRTERLMVLPEEERAEGEAGH
ncbi:MAG: hypothetical protein KY469_21685 [Actinobacteria bacterium]|nr:hypothetical protein [Actinomycetota bacterium]